MKLSDIYYDSHFGEFEELFRQSGVPVHFRKGEAIPPEYFLYGQRPFQILFCARERYGKGDRHLWTRYSDPVLPMSAGFGKKLRLQGLLQIPDPDGCGRYMPEAGNVSQTV